MMHFNPMALMRRTWALHGPAIVTGLGVALNIGGTIWACHSSVKISRYLEDRERDELGLFAGTDDGEDLAKGKAVVKQRIRDGLEIAKRFAGPAAMIGGGIFCIAKGHGMMVDKLTMASAAYTALSASYATYREGVRQEYGEDVDRLFARGLKKTGKMADVELEDGAKVSVPEVAPIEMDEEEQVKTLAKLGYSPDELLKDTVEIRWNRETSPTQWSHDKQVNLMFLSGKEAAMNRKAAIDGMISVWDMAEMLGIPVRFREPEWQIMVWYPTPQDNTSERDGDPIKMFEIGIFDPCNDMFLDTGRRDMDTNECWLSLPVRGLLLPGQFPFGRGKYVPGGRFQIADRK